MKTLEQRQTTVTLSDRTLVVAIGFAVATLTTGLITPAHADYSEVLFAAPAGKNRQYTRVYVDGESCYLESDAECNNTITLYSGSGSGSLHRVRYAMYPSNGGFASEEIAHLDVWYNLPSLGGSPGNPTAYDVTIPISLVTFAATPNPGNGYQVYVLSSDNVGHYLDATRPKKHNSALGFYVGNATTTVANIELLAGCYTVSFASPWNNTGTSGLRPITKYWTLEEPICLDGVNDYTVDWSIGPPNNSPDCTNAVAGVDTLWPPNHRLVPVAVLGTTDSDGDDVTISVTSIFQDEPVNGSGDGDTAPDGFGVGTDMASVRAERAGGGNGRVYTIGFSAEDGAGGMCAGEVSVGVPKSQGKKGGPVDDGALYDSTGS